MFSKGDMLNENQASIAPQSRTIQKDCQTTLDIHSDLSTLSFFIPTSQNRALDSNTLSFTIRLHHLLPLTILNLIIVSSFLSIVAPLLQSFLYLSSSLFPDSPLPHSITLFFLFPTPFSTSHNWSPQVSGKQSKAQPPSTPIVNDICRRKEKEAKGQRMTQICSTFLHCRSQISLHKHQ